MSLPNINSELNKSFCHVESSLPRSVSSPAAINQEPTCTKTLLNKLSGDKELTVIDNFNVIHDQNKHPEEKKDSDNVSSNITATTPPAKVSLYEELLASTAFDDDDESQSLAQALALSQQEYYSNLS
jgi:hypothetical protein